MLSLSCSNHSNWGCWTVKWEWLLAWISLGSLLLSWRWLAFWSVRASVWTRRGLEEADDRSLQMTRGQTNTRLNGVKCCTESHDSLIQLQWFNSYQKNQSQGLIKKQARILVTVHLWKTSITANHFSIKDPQRNDSREKSCISQPGRLHKHSEYWDVI